MSGLVSVEVLRYGVPMMGTSGTALSIRCWVTMMAPIGMLKELIRRPVLKAIVFGLGISRKLEKT